MHWEFSSKFLITILLIYIFSCQVYGVEPAESAILNNENLGTLCKLNHYICIFSFLILLSTNELLDSMA